MSLSSLKHRILPILKVVEPEIQKSDKEPVIEFSESNTPVLRNLIGDLVIFLGIDKGNYFDLLLSNQLPSGFDTSLLFDASTKNLSRLLEGEVQIGHTPEGINGFISDPDHTASLILLPQYLDYAKNSLEDDLIIAAPSKDVLSFVRASESRMVEELETYVHETHEAAEKPLSKMLFRFDGESLSEYAP